MNYSCPSRRGSQRLHYVCACALVLVSLFFAASSANAQDAAEAARQEKARKASQSQKPQSHVYTNDDLQRPQILAPEDRATVEARKKTAAPPAANETTPSNAGVEDAAAPESLGEIARRLRREKAVRQVEQAGKVPPPSLFKMELPAQSTLAHPKALSSPLIAPSPLSSKTARPWVGTGSMKRDPFSRAAVSTAPRNSISAPALQPIAPRATLSPVAPRSSRVESKDRPISVRIQTGDSLWNLSRQYLGKGSLWQGWISTNPQLSDPRRLQPGTVLVVPNAAAAMLPRPQVRTVPPTKDLLPSGTVSVQSGDSLWRIASKHFGRGAEWTCLAHANPELQDVDRIYPGQTLVVPLACGVVDPAVVAPAIPTPKN